MIVFNDERFSMTRLRTSFISMFASWAVVLSSGIVLLRELFCVFYKSSWGGRH